MSPHQKSQSSSKSESFCQSDVSVNNESVLVDTLTLESIYNINESNIDDALTSLSIEAHDCLYKINYAKI